MDQPTNPEVDGATRATGRQRAAKPLAAPRFWVLAGHFRARVAWLHKVFSYLHLFRWSEQVVATKFRLSSMASRQ